MLIDPEPLREHGMIGACLWYVAEMQARTEYYRLLLQAQSRIHVHTVSPDALKTEDGARMLLDHLGVADAAAELEIPPAKNATQAFHLGDDVRANTQTLVEGYQFNVREIAEEFFNSGRRL